MQVALLQHPRRTVQLTPQGETLLEYARRMITLNDEALSSVRGDELAGRVRIGAIITQRSSCPRCSHALERIIPAFRLSCTPGSRPTWRGGLGARST